MTNHNQYPNNFQSPFTVYLLTCVHAIFIDSRVSYPRLPITYDPLLRAWFTKKEYQGTQWNQSKKKRLPSLVVSLRQEAS